MSFVSAFLFLKTSCDNLFDRSLIYLSVTTAEAFERICLTSHLSLHCSPCRSRPTSHTGTRPQKELCHALENFQRTTIKSDPHFSCPNPPSMSDIVRRTECSIIRKCDHVAQVAAARLANAHDFISTLPDGYKTEIGVPSALASQFLCCCSFFFVFLKR